MKRHYAPEKLAPKKRFSQNFLTDTRTAGKIASQLDAGSQDVILEIGPGSGALTSHLLQTPAMQVTAVELDPRAVKSLEPLQQEHSARLRIEQGDVLKIDASTVYPSTSPEHRLVIGNIPYAITSDILFWLFEQRFAISRSVIMMQLEVAQRCVARPGTKDYGILSVASWYAAKATLVMRVQPGSFYPRPKVTSAVVRFDMRKESPTNADFEPFMRFVRAAFGQRRKVLTNSLSTWASVHAPWLRSEPIVCGTDLASTRAEQLAPEELAAIFVDLQSRQEARHV